MSDEAERRARERVGSVLNEKWSLERLLGIGGMAAVYAARHRNGARAAVKVLHSELSSNDGVRGRFQREGYAANRVGHPGAVKVLDDDVVSGGPDSGTAYLVMELLEGESLHDRLERGPPVGEREFLAIAQGVLDVLVAAHEHGVVHRDLKPENLFLVHPPGSPGALERKSMRARVKVLDFGLARLLHGHAITSHGLALGTPSFMSPEQASGKIAEIDGRTDLFALAATGFRLRTGRRIHEGGNAVELVTKMANFAAPRIRTVGPDVSEPFARVIDRGLEFRREDRYESAAAMRDDVGRALAELDAAVAITVLAASPPPRPAGPAREPTMEVSASDFERSQRREAGQPAVRRRSIALWALSLSVGALATIGTKRWLADRSALTRLPSAPPDQASSGPSADAAAAEVEPPALDAEVSFVSADAPTLSSSPSATAPALRAPTERPPPLVALPLAGPAHRRAPPMVGPGNVHKLPKARPARPSSPPPKSSRP